MFSLVHNKLDVFWYTTVYDIDCCISKHMADKQGFSGPQNDLDLPYLVSYWLSSVPQTLQSAKISKQEDDKQCC